jgi:hypothetical protein
LYEKNFHPEGNLTQILYSRGGCDDHCATNQFPFFGEISLWPKNQLSFDES